MKSALTAGNDRLLSDITAARKTSGCIRRPMAVGYSVAFTCGPEFSIIDASHQDESPPACHLQTLRKQTSFSAQSGAVWPVQLSETPREARRLSRPFAKTEITPHAAHRVRDASLPMDKI